MTHSVQFRIQSSTLCYYDLTILMDFDHCLGINYQSSDRNYIHYANGAPDQILFKLCRILVYSYYIIFEKLIH